MCLNKLGVYLNYMFIQIKCLFKFHVYSNFVSIQDEMIF